MKKRDEKDPTRAPPAETRRAPPGPRRSESLEAEIAALEAMLEPAPGEDSPPKGAPREGAPPEASRTEDETSDRPSSGRPHTGGAT